MPRARRIVVGGLSSPVIEAGPQDEREAVVFVHGNPGSSTDWTALVDATGELGRAVAMDMPGFGKADKPRDFDYQVSAYADFLQGALTELGIERVHLVLHDFGGAFGLFWGLQHPQAWASVVLINIGIMPGYEWHTMARRWRTPVLGELTQAWIPRAGWRRAMHDDYDHATRRAVLKLYRATPDPGSTALELGAEMAKLHKPALVIWGAKDPFIGVEFAERQREFFEVADVAILQESGHWPFQDDPQRVAQTVLPFLRKQLGVRSPA
jgi:pimeloyl-ACP methyl ester carboxylesterase